MAFSIVSPFSFMYWMPLYIFATPDHFVVATTGSSRPLLFVAFFDCLVSSFTTTDYQPLGLRSLVGLTFSIRWLHRWLTYVCHSERRCNFEYDHQLKICPQYFCRIHLLRCTNMGENNNFRSNPRHLFFLLSLFFLPFF
jgi:hypothetical protein